MDRFRELSVFVAVADAGAFNAAARRLNMSAAAVTRLINRLEDRIGAQLITRTTRRLALTSAGIRLLEDGRRILSELDDAEAAATGAHKDPSGDLHVTAPVLFGRRFMAPVIREFLNLYPRITVRLELLDRIVDLMDEGIDVALRIGTMPDSTMHTQRIGSVRLVTVAAPSYLAKAGAIDEPSDLIGQEIVNTTNLHARDYWQFVGGGGKIEVRISPRLSMNSAEAAIAASVDGWGITRVLSYQVADALADGALAEVLHDYETREIPVQLVHHEGRRTTAKTRAFVDFAARRLRAEARRLAAL